MALRQRLGHTIAALDRYAQGVRAMRAANTYHKYVFWHSQVGSFQDPTDPAGLRNVAHRGPAFLPWHREFIWRFERDLDAALADDDFGLPYWNWAADKTNGQLASSRVWTALGSNIGAVSLGGTPWTRMSATLVGTSYSPQNLITPVRRDFDGFDQPFGHIADIRDQDQAAAHMADTSQPYDQSQWNIFSVGFRNTNERSFHDHVHVLVGGDLGDMSVPPQACNDPIFFLHHAMIDRLWGRWQDAGVAAGIPREDQYHPNMSEAAGILQGQRIDEPMWPWSNAVEMGRWGLPTENITPRMVLDHRNARLNYVYDDQDPGGCLPAAARIIRELIARLGRRRG